MILGKREKLALYDTMKVFKRGKLPIKDGELRRVLRNFYPGRRFRKVGFSVTVLIVNVIRRKTSLTKCNKIEMNEYQCK